MENFDLEEIPAGINDKTPPSEIARKLVKSVADPYIELQQKGYVNGLRIIIRGSVVNNLKEPGDYDIVVLFDDHLQKGTKDGEDLSTKAKMAMNKLTSSPKNEYGQDTTIFIDFTNKINLPHADRADIEITSTDNFLKHLNEDKNEKKKEVIQQLFNHPKVIYRQAVPDDEILNYDPGVDYETIDKTVLYGLIMAQGFHYKLTEKDLEILSKYSHDFIPPKNLSHQERLTFTETYLEKNLHKLLNEEQIREYKKNLQGNQNKNLPILGEVTNRFLESTNLSAKFKSRVIWIFGMLKHNINGEELTSQDGFLIYGDNINNYNGKPIFKEDKNFINL